MGRLSSVGMSRKTTDPRVAIARRTILEGVGAEVAASFPGITRLGGQIVAALYLAETPCSMDDLCAELGRSKSNVFTNVRALEGAGILERQRAHGARSDVYLLRGKYPDVIIGAYLGRLRRVVADKRALSARALHELGDATGEEAARLRAKLTKLGKKYDKFAGVFEELLPAVDGPIDLERLIAALPASVLRILAKVARRALGA